MADFLAYLVYLSFGFTTIIQASYLPYSLNSDLRRTMKLSVILLTLFCAVSQAQENRSITGYGTNLQNPEWGSTHSPLLHPTTRNYTDGMQGMDEEGRPARYLVSLLTTICPW